MADSYQRFTVAFIDADGKLLGSAGVELEARRAADPSFLTWAALDVLARRGPDVQGVRAAMFVGRYSDAELARGINS